MAKLFCLLIGALLASQEIAAQCAGSVQIISERKLKLTFDPAQDSIPLTISYNGEEFFLSPSGESNVYFIDNFLPGGTDLSVEVFLNFENSTQTCVYGGDGNLAIAAPVSLSFFSAYLEKEDVHLHWATENELNNVGFEIQQSFNGYSFETITFIPGMGTSSSSSTYTFEDNNIRTRALNNLIYYRLKQIDFDGSFSYSPIISVDLDLKFQQFEITKITGWNSSHALIKVYLQNYADTRKIIVLLADLNGRIIERRTLLPETGLNYLEFDLSDQQNNFFVLSLYNGKTIIAEKIVLQQDY